jgi:hypothetical protein
MLPSGSRTQEQLALDDLEGVQVDDRLGVEQEALLGQHISDPLHPGVLFDVVLKDLLASLALGYVLEDDHAALRAIVGLERCRRIGDGDPAAVTASEEIIVDVHRLSGRKRLQDRTLLYGHL